MDVMIRPATARDAEAVSSILQEAAKWLDGRGIPLWRANELALDCISDDVIGGLFVLAESGGHIAGTMKFQLEDQMFWPDVPNGESAFVHRLAVRRQFAGGCVSHALLRYAVSRARSLGREFLRLDCDAARPKLRALYERFGFKYHSDRRVGPYLVARYEYEVNGSPPSGST